MLQQGGGARLSQRPLGGAGTTERSLGPQGQGLEGAGMTAEQEEAREGTGHQDRRLPETGTWGGQPRGWLRQPARAHG